jgi:hypothetical protein
MYIKKIFLLFLIINYEGFGQSLVKQWDYRYGGTMFELLWGLQQTADGGFILAGSTSSGANGDITQPNWGISYDMWIVKTDANGILQWQKRYGGDQQDRCQAMAQNANGDYLLGGFTQSDVSGDVTAPKYIPGFDTDYWVVLIDANGNKIWDKRFGGSQGDFLYAVAATADGGYILGGSSLSAISGIKTENSKGQNDFWIVKIDASGNKQWDKTIGGNNSDNLAGITQTSDHGYVMAGWSYSDVSGDKSQPCIGDKDFWIVKTDSLGNKLWDKTYGGINADWLMCFTPLSNGGFMLGGFTASPQGNDISEASRGYYDLWILKTDAAGNKIWDKRIGGISDDDEMGSIIETLDGGYLVSGTSYSDAGADKSEDNLGVEQSWAIKLDAAGAIQWDKTIFTTGHDETTYAVQTADSCYVFANWTAGDIGGYKSQPSWTPAGYVSDYWIIKFCNDALPLPAELISFTALSSGTKNILYWTTASETNNDFFSVEKSTDGSNFKSIGIVQGNGNTTQEKHYSFTDINSLPGTSYYRLKQADFNGKISYSKVISINSSNQLSTVEIFPQPAHDLINLQGACTDKAAITISDCTGKILFTNTCQSKIDISKFSPGAYFLKIQDGYASTVKMFVKY